MEFFFLFTFAYFPHFNISTRVLRSLVEFMRMLTNAVRVMYEYK